MTVKKEKENSNATLAQSADESKTVVACKDETSSASAANIMYMQEVGFNIKIQAPGVDEFSVQVSSMELVQEIHQLLMDREDTCHRTCFSLQLNGVTLDNFSELKSVEGLSEGSVLKVVEESYTVREARIHVRHIRDLLLKSGPANANVDAFAGQEGASLSFLNAVCAGDVVERMTSSASRHVRSNHHDGNAGLIDCTPSDYILPGANEINYNPPTGVPFTPIHPMMASSPTLSAFSSSADSTTSAGGGGTNNVNNGNANGACVRLANCLRVLTTSMWNPPPPTRRLHGDLLYIWVVTAEGRRLCITACPRGFYLNRSTDDVFDPRPQMGVVLHGASGSNTNGSSAADGADSSMTVTLAGKSTIQLPSTPTTICHSLVDLLSAVSAVFRRSFWALQKQRTARHPFERVATPYQVYTWLGQSPPVSSKTGQQQQQLSMLPQYGHILDAIRAEDASSSKLGYEEHIPGQTRDWNEEMQTTRELSRKTLPERLLRERAIFKVHSDFVSAATRGAMAVVDGCVMPINPGESRKMQMYIWNNIFFSLGFDVRDHYKRLGGDAAAHVAPRNDLQGVKVYNAVDLEGLCTLGTVVVDYRGMRVTAQSIIPGILEREQEQSVVYGSIDFGKTVVAHPKYVDLLAKASNQLKIIPHTVVNEKGDEVLLCSSVECKGIIGNDGRHYILDLLRTFPPDVNFLDLTDLDDEDATECKDEAITKTPAIELSKEAKALGFPIIHGHKLSCLRQELIDAFVEARYVMFIKYAAVQLQQIEQAKHAEGVVHNSDSGTVKGTDDADSEEKLISSLVKNAELSTTAAGDATIMQDDTDEGICDEEAAKKAIMSVTDSKDAMERSQPTEDSTRDIVKRAAKAVGSLKETEFDIRFNPDLFSPGVKHAPSELVPGGAFDKQKALVRDAADFLLTVQIPAFVRDCLEQVAVPMDGRTLADALHNRGINIRYLGVMAKMVGRVKQLQYVHSITVAEIVTRSAKHIFTTYLQNVELTCVSAAVAHFLNCFLTSGCREANAAALITAGILVTAPSSGSSGQPSSGGSTKGRRRNKGKDKRHYYHPPGKDSNAGANQDGKQDSSEAAQTQTSSNKVVSPFEWITLTSETLWSKVVAEAASYYNFDLKQSDEEQVSVDGICRTYRLHKVSILRSICQKVGIQLQLREYNLRSYDYLNVAPAKTETNGKGANGGSNGATSTYLPVSNGPFGEDDVVNMFPIVKHINPRASDAYNFYTTGQAKIQQGFLKDGYELVSEALNLLNNVYGAMHPEIAQCLRMLARLNYIMGEHADALVYQQKAVLMSERVNGCDHPYTITEYVHLALYCFANSQLSTALKLLYRARYLTLFVFGEKHPEIALIDANIGLILHVVGEYSLSQRFQMHSLELNKMFHGERSLKVAVSYHLLAKTQSCMGDFRSALLNEKETFMIYKLHLGENHDKTRESSEALKQFTQQAVIMQKKMNEICHGQTAGHGNSGKSSVASNAAGGLSQLQIQPPSMASVLDMLNIINGILFVQISQQDIENFKTEMERRAAAASALADNSAESKAVDSHKADLADCPLD